MLRATRRVQVVFIRSRSDIFAPSRTTVSCTADKSSTVRTSFVYLSEQGVSYERVPVPPPSSGLWPDWFAVLKKRCFPAFSGSFSSGIVWQAMSGCVWYVSFNPSPSSERVFGGPPAGWCIPRPGRFLRRDTPRARLLTRHRHETLLDGIGPRAPRWYGSKGERKLNTECDKQEGEGLSQASSRFHTPSANLEHASVER